MRTEFGAELTLPVSEERDHVQGPAAAPVTLVEYGDYECPYCGAAYPIIKEVQSRMGDRLRFVFRNFPKVVCVFIHRDGVGIDVPRPQGDSSGARCSPQVLFIPHRHLEYSQSSSAWLKLLPEML